MSEETTTETKQNLITGFAILIDQKGNVYVERDMSYINASLEREATLIEIRRYCSEILMDIAAQSAAEYTMVKLAMANRDKEATAEEQK
jgi:hypothetical protein